jgi:hypothetical protein
MTTILELEALCASWLGRFQMAEWLGDRPSKPGVPRVRVSIRSKKRMGNDVGSCCWQAEDCTADIELLRGQGEDTLIHEILHLALEGHTTYADTVYSELHERALNRLAAGCLALDRRVDEKP